MSFGTGQVGHSRSVTEPGEHDYLTYVFAWTCLALVLTAAVAQYVHTQASITNYFFDNRNALLILWIVQLVMVFAVRRSARHLSLQVTALVYVLLASLVGVTFGVLLSVYTSSSVAMAFGGASGVFAGMAVYGWFTDSDLSGLGMYLFGGMIGVIAASVMFLFVGGHTLNLIIGYAGVLVFSLFTSYDMQRIKRVSRTRVADTDSAHKLAIFGALNLYLDFVNLVFSLLRIMGGRR